MGDFARTLSKLASCITVQLPRRVFQIAFAHNVVAIEDFSGLVARDAHGDFFRHAGPDQVAHSGPAKIVKQQPQISTLIFFFVELRAPSASLGPDRFASAVHADESALRSCRGVLNRFA
jgi:hypothetical protein